MPRSKSGPPPQPLPQKIRLKIRRPLTSSGKIPTTRYAPRIAFGTPATRNGPKPTYVSVQKALETKLKRTVPPLRRSKRLAEKRQQETKKN